MKGVVFDVRRAAYLVTGGKEGIGTNVVDRQADLVRRDEGSFCLTELLFSQ